MHVINIITPVFVIIAIGFVLRRYNFLSETTVTGLNRLTYYVGLPALLFYKIASSTYDLQTAGKTYLVVIGGMFVCLIVAMIIAYVMRLPFSSSGTFIQGACRGNLAYIGLPIVFYSFQHLPAMQSQHAQTIAVLVLAMTVPVYNVLSVSVLLISRHTFDRKCIKRIIRSLLTNPLLISCIAGMVYSVCFDSMPAALSRTTSSIGQMALPLALLAIGAAMVAEKVTGNILPALVSSLIKTLVSPVAGVILAKMLNLSPDETAVALIFLACPTAIASHTLTTEIGGNPKLAASIVILSTLLAAVSLSVAVAISF
ncbi:MAG: AEC family transporter [Anaerohalosphaera sp.]|nr:AEC family transporter [Anaerohalosphaera sp.]